MTGHLVLDGVPPVGTALPCGCTVRLLSTSPCPRCGTPPFGGFVGRFPVSALVGEATTLEVGCPTCGAEYTARARVLA